MRCLALQHSSLLLISGFILTFLAHAADPTLPSTGARSPLQGLVIDKTLTPPGRNFYKQFARLWWELNPTLRDNLVIAENPDALRGSQIIITMNRKLLYITALSPARSEIEKKASNAVNSVEHRVKYLLNPSNIQASEDLAEDEF
ncbi:CsgE family curli-type amyloid fiber assembly protein [Endozoicomonas numazuensis]|uniref:CsgE family curli-type amyloid fiber assembly protein n=1 Tax=Endozoicomonas numazuensis TaxID=1137799 RepID=UPI00068BD708|nr:CsgE family curli-type amyloid fiber assembly protein [Endozoicomonas numazuensis]